MRFYFDTEFDEDGKTIELISIGIVRDDGAGYYAVNNEFDPRHCNDWVHENVLPKLPPKTQWISRAQIKSEVLTFVGLSNPQFWAYHADYDWVVLCQLFGRMVDLPEQWPHHAMDLKQLMVDRGILKEWLPKREESAHHNALGDAEWCRQCHYHIMGWPMQYPMVPFNMAP